MYVTFLMTQANLFRKISFKIPELLNQQLCSQKIKIKTKVKKIRKFVLAEHRDMVKEFKYPFTFVASFFIKVEDHSFCKIRESFNSRFGSVVSRLVLSRTISWFHYFALINF